MIAAIDNPATRDAGEVGMYIEDSALAVDTVVVPDRGQWGVDIVVYFHDGVVRHRVNTYPTKNRAEISARLIKRGAERDLRGPLNG